MNRQTIDRLKEIYGDPLPDYVEGLLRIATASIRHTLRVDVLTWMLFRIAAHEREMSPSQLMRTIVREWLAKNSSEYRAVLPIVTAIEE